MKGWFGRLLAVLTLSLPSMVWSAVQDSVTFTNVIPTQTTNFALGTVRTHEFTNTGYTLGRIDFSGNLEEINGTTGDFGSDNRVRVTFPDGRFKNVTLTSVAGYVGVLHFSGSFYVAAGEVPPFGGTWTFSFVNVFDDAPGGGVPDARINTITFELTDELPAEPSAVDLDTIASPGILGHATPVGPAQVRWIRFQVGETTTGARYFDIDTEGTIGFIGGGTPNDTVIALYSQFGEVLAIDDEDGSDSRSQLTFGPDAGTRPPIGNSAVYDGRDGVLQAGKVYYLAICGFGGYFSDGFVATSDSTRSGSIITNFRTNVLPPTQLTGTVDLQDLDVAPTGQQVVVEVRAVGGFIPLQMQVVTLNASGEFAMNLIGAIVPGSYDVTAKGSHWLRKRVGSVTITETGASGLTFSLPNGDCDGDNEVSIGDYAILSGGFGTCEGDVGYVSSADLNGDDCIDIGDFAILSANFGLTGDD